MQQANDPVTGIVNDRLLRALLRQPVDRTPVWIMRQAGRYLPEYRATRERAGDFLTLCKTPELACEVTLQPLARFPLDAAILFSDILTIPDAMGLGLTLDEGVGPRFESPIRDRHQIHTLPRPDPNQELRYVTDAVALIKRELDNTLPLIGFSGSPWTLATYMVEGGGSKEFRLTKTLMFDHPEAMHQLLQTVSDSVTDYLNAQIESGIDAVMLFDTWGGVLSGSDYQTFSLRYMEQIVAQLQRQRAGVTIPVVVFTKGGGLWLESIAEIGCHAVGLDWTVDIGNARHRIGDQVALQGNLDPNVLHAAPDKIREQVRTILERFGHGSGHVFNLGHGIQPQVPPDHVKVLVDTVHEISPAFHR